MEIYNLKYISRCIIIEFSLSYYANMNKIQERMNKIVINLKLQWKCIVIS